MVMNSFIGDIFEKVVGVAGKLSRYAKKATLSSREVQTAVRLVLPASEEGQRRARPRRAALQGRHERTRKPRASVRRVQHRAEL